MADYTEIYNEIIKALNTKDMTKLHIWIGHSKEYTVKQHLMHLETPIRQKPDSVWLFPLRYVMGREEATFQLAKRDKWELAKKMWLGDDNEQRKRQQQKAELRKQKRV